MPAPCGGAGARGRGVPAPRRGAGARRACAAQGRGGAACLRRAGARRTGARRRTAPPGRRPQDRAPPHRAPRAAGRAPRTAHRAPRAAGRRPRTTAPRPPAAHRTLHTTAPRPRPHTAPRTTVPRQFPAPPRRCAMGPRAWPPGRTTARPPGLTTARPPAPGRMAAWPMAAWPHRGMARCVEAAMATADPAGHDRSRRTPRIVHAATPPPLRCGMNVHSAAAWRTTWQQHSSGSST
ncbi:hypothetical protein SAMN05443668_1244 [Cryptosporangium aurantiacum]|uniref:Uncharacterized protein n=1 Tax=Cryptosporangium aurantiacum TaxID=134849 RepID=A0A1M7RMX3_9ACTN|nr:hypothetical protein SAMN05443668_1244 [Cryptosporangium aurantiacum]